MKKITLLLAFVVISLFSNAQLSEYKGALGVEFGCSRDAVRQMMTTKHPDAKFYQAKNNSLQWTDGKWAGSDVLVWTFSFTDSGKLHTIKVTVLPSAEYAVWDLYKEFSDNLIQKYGWPKNDFKTWKDPYTISDKEAYGISALKNGKVDYSMYWEKSNDPSNPEDVNSISIEITTYVNVRVTYQNGLLIDEAIKSSNDKKQGDM